MAKFLVRRLIFTLFTMLFVSVLIFAVVEIGPGDVVRHMLGQFATPEQEDSMRAQLGLTRPAWQRYFIWLIGSDTFWARPKVGMPLRQEVSPQTGFPEWWAEDADGTLIRWRLDGEDLIAIRRQPDGSGLESPDNGRWNINVADEAERMRAYREELLVNPQLLDQDRQAIVEQVERLIEILDRGLSDQELPAALAGPEQALDGLKDEDASTQRKALQIAASGMGNNAVVVALSDLRTLLDTSGTPGDEFLQSVPNRLGIAATALARTRPELAEGLRAASKSLLERDMDAVRDAAAGLVDPLGELTKPLTDLAGELEGDDYAGAAALLEAIFDPSKPPDPALMALMGAQFKDTTRAVQDMMPDLAEDFGQASESLTNGDADAAQEALGRIVSFFRARGPVIVRSQAVKRAKVGRSFWGVDNANHAVLWQTHGDQTFWRRAKAAGWWVEEEGGPVEYIPLTKGFVRGDPGESFRTRQPVGAEMLRRLRNSVVLAALAFVVVMPLALLLGLIAGLNEGKTIDRVLSIFGLVTTASPSFATGVFLVLVFSIWLKVLPGATVFSSSSAIFESPQMLVLPVATLTLIELGYVLRMTRASMVEVMNTAYIRTAFLKGLPYRRIVFRHALRNALMAPITVIMLHVNWLLGGIVVVETIFGFPGLGNFLLSSALYKDTFAIEAGAMLMVIMAVGTQLVADIIYTFLNPRIRYA